MNKIVHLHLKMCFGIFIFLFSIGTSHATIIETTGEDNCNRVDTIELGDGFSVKHISFQADRHLNIGRTEVYKDYERIDFHDTVFYANSRWTWWYSAPACATHSRISTATFNNGILNLTFDSFNPQGGSTGNYATTTRPRLNSNPLQINIGKQEVSTIGVNAYAIGSGFNHAMKLNMTHSGSHIGGASRRVEVFSNGRDATPGSRLRSSYYYGHRGCEVIDISQTDIEYVVDFSCELTYTKTRSAINGGGFTQVYDYNGSFELSKERYDLCSYDEQFCDNIPLNPVNLTQETQSPNPGGEDLSRDTIEVGTSVGKYQSGSGIILGASTLDENPEELSLHIDVYNKGEIIPIFSNTTSFNASGSGELIVPNLSVGEYYWTAKVVSNDGYESETEQFANNTIFDTDFALFEGFEPYPYGYSFRNNKVESGLLKGDGFFNWKGFFDLSGYYKVNNIVDGNKWNIFRKAFDVSSIEDNDRKMINAFESVGLNRNDVFQGGSCYGMALSSVIHKSSPDFLETYFSSFSSTIGDGSIWENIDAPISTDNSSWDIYNNSLEAILALQLSQESVHSSEAKLNGFIDSEKVIRELKDNSYNNYVLNFWGVKKSQDENGEIITKDVGHAVIPYKIEEQGDTTRIYIWDNNIPFPHKLSYKVYITVFSDGTWELPLYKYDSIRKKGWISFDRMSLVNVNALSKKSAPRGFNGTDVNYTLSGSSDLYVVDAFGNISGFIDGDTIQEIPGVEVIVPLNDILDSEVVESTWKQIYLPQKQNLTVKVSSNEEESYDLMIAGGDYYTKIEGVETSSGQIDTYNISREQIQLDFDNNKVGDYNLIIDDFQGNGTGTVYRRSIVSTNNLEQYNIDWDEMTYNELGSVKYQIDLDNDGILDVESYYNALPNSENELGSISGYVLGEKNMAGWKICLDQNGNGTCEEKQEKFVITDKDGYYEFSDLERGEYTIIEVLHQNWGTDKNSYNIFMNHGQSIKNLNFENKFLKANNKK